MNTLKYIFLTTALSASFVGCQLEPRERRVVPEPHLEMGQQLTIVGSEPNQTYLIVGYRETFAGPVQLHYHEQPYVVFMYQNNNGDFSTATIHVNSIVKK